MHATILPHHQSICFSTTPSIATQNSRPPGVRSFFRLCRGETMPELMKQISFGKLDQGMEMPHLLDIQTRAFEALLQLDAASHDREDIGLERVFKDLFPITDVHENFSLEFVRYSLGEPKYTVEECIERDMTYSAPLKATLQLVINESVNEQQTAAQHHREGGLSR